MTFLSTLAEYQWVILFYLVIIAIVYFKRDKFDFQSKFIALYRTKIGIKLMHWAARHFGPIIRVWGYIGIFIGYAGMLLIVFFLFEGLYKLVFVPLAPATLAPVIPGVPIPGSPLFVPFWYGISALFFVVVVHEFSHGVVAAAHDIRVKNSGIMFFGPLVGAFVEPDENKLKKKGWWAQQSMFAAGPVSNAVLSALVLVVLLFGLFPLLTSMVSPNGFFFADVSEGFPAIEAGVQPEVIYTSVNGVIVNNSSFLADILETASPGDTIILANDEMSHTIVLTQSPDNPERAYLGIVGLQTKSEVNNPNNKTLFDGLNILSKFLQWVFILSMGIGLANLLPLGPVDGGRMLHLSLDKKLGKKRALKIFSKTTIFFLIIIAILLIVPIIKALI